MFDVERVLSGYTQKKIYEELTTDELIERWIMIQNHEHMERENDIAMQVALNPFKKEKTEYERTPLLFKNLNEKVATEKFDREKAWEEAPEYDLSQVAAALGSL